jgi:hypothetical protein
MQQIVLRDKFSNYIFTKDGMFDLNLKRRSLRVELSLPLELFVTIYANACCLPCYSVMDKWAISGHSMDVQFGIKPRAIVLYCTVPYWRVLELLSCVEVMNVVLDKRVRTHIVRSIFYRFQIT